MNIQKATVKALAEGKSMHRMSWNSSLEIIPTNTSRCCIMFCCETDKVGLRWEPSAKDLIADDWE